MCYNFEEILEKSKSLLFNSSSKLKDENLIKLPSNNLTKSLKLAYLIKKKKNKSIKIIDLRIKNRIVIK